MRIRRTAVIAGLTPAEDDQASSTAKGDNMAAALGEGGQRVANTSTSPARLLSRQMTRLSRKETRAVRDFRFVNSALHARVSRRSRTVA